jgi:hypothetical protein
MNSIRKFAGILWIALGPLAMFYLIKTASAEIAKKPLAETKIQWLGFVIVFIPIAIGMIIFGFYALRGEYQINTKDE